MSILCVGQMVADILVKPMNVLDFAVDTQLVESIGVKPGGDALNTAIVLGKLGQPVRFCGKCGMDGFGDMLTAEMENNGVSASLVCRDPGSATSSVIVAINSQGERAFYYMGGTNNTFSYTDIPAAALEGCSIAHVGGTYNLPKFDGEGAARFFQAARSQGVLTSMDVTWDSKGRWLETIAPCLPHLNFFMPSESEARQITGKDSPEAMAAFLREKGVETAIIKLGADGCYVQGTWGSFYAPAYKVHVADTTGAGDCFVAGFLTGILRKWELPACARFGAAVAAFCVQQVGATAGVPGFDAVEAFIRAQG